MHTNSFVGVFDGNTDFSAATEANTVQEKRKVEFRKTISALADAKGKIPADILRKFVFEDNKPRDFQSAELMEIFIGFRKEKAWEDMLRLLAEAENPEFSNADIAREFSAVACNMMGQYDRTIEICQGLLDDDLVNGEVYGALGKAYLKKGDLQKSYEFYNLGFLHSFESYPGINAAYRLLDMGQEKSARDVARMVFRACVRDNVQETMDYWCACTAVEAAILMRDRRIFDEAMDLFKAYAVKASVEPWQFNSTLESLDSVSANLSKNGISNEYFGLAKDMLADMAAKAAAGTLAAEAESQFDIQVKTLDLRREFLKASYNYRGLASNFIGQHYISGNFRFNGQLPDHSLTRTDRAEFQKVMEAPLVHFLGLKLARAVDKELSDLHNKKDFWWSFPRTLADIPADQPETFLKIADALIRKTFNTDARQLEHMLSEGHAEYDQIVHALVTLSGIKNKDLDVNLVDSRTNISVLWALGLGDCRHHGQVKQMLFDTWQNNHMNETLRQAYHALERNDRFGFEDAIEKFHEIEAVELRTFDVHINLPVKTDGGFPVCDKDGNMILDRANAKGEPHTLTILSKKDAAYMIRTVWMEDSFYQNHFELGHGRVSIDDVSVTEDGKLCVNAKPAKAIDPDTGALLDVDVKLVSAPWAGAQKNVASDEHGKLLLFGIPVSEGFDLVSLLCLPEEKRNERLLALKEWSEASGNIAPVLLQRRQYAATANDAVPKPSMSA